ncbi:uncharacterized protein [Rhodnius prolixus]|uniref:uncharacterized protein n=1 Tax=Rhodnius prolixus TaxID=13249 RepID=UPI003D189A0B
MGCNASKVVIPVAEEATETPETAEDASTKSTETFTVPAPPNDNNGDDDITISARTSNGLAFEVPISEEENVIKRHPPKRLQRLEDQQMPSLTHRLLDEKQAEAEQRRLQILNQRIRSAKSRQKLKRSSFINNGESNGLLIESMHQEPSTVAL